TTAHTNRSPYGTPQHTSPDPLTAQSVELSASEFEQFKVEPAGERDFTIQRGAVGNIAFNEEMSVPVFPPVQGKIITLFARAGDDVKRGMSLYTIDSPDLVQAGSSLIAAAGVLRLTTRVLQRARQLYEVQGIAQKDLDQAVSEQQAAEGAFKAARDAVRIFGKTDADMDRIIAERKIDPVLVVRDPKHDLRSGMFAAFVIRTGMAVRSPAVPLNGVIREGDGTMAIWVTTDRKRLVKRTVKVGLEQDGFDQILEGLQPGELVATEGALFLSNALTAASR